MGLPTAETKDSAVSFSRVLYVRLTRIKLH